MINFYYKSISDINLQKLLNFKKGCLIYCFDCDEKDLEILKKKFKLNENLLKDALDIYEIPRIEKDNNQIYLFLRLPYFEKKNIFTSVLLIVIDKYFIAFISLFKNEIIENFLIEKQKDIFTTQKNKLVIQFYYYFYNYFEKIILRINKEIRKNAFNIQEVSDNDLKRLIKLEIIFHDLIDALVSNKTVLNNILRGNILNLFPQDKELIEDLLIKMEEIEKLSKAIDRNLVNIREGYENIFTNNINQILKILTFLTILISIPTMLSSFYGMNLTLPLQDFKYTFYLIIFISLTLIVLLFLIFKYKKWL
jgi:magnesium transporter